MSAGPLIVEITSGEVKPIACLHVLPLSVEYMYLVIAEPPFIPSVKFIDNLFGAGVIEVIVGAFGATSGVTAADATEFVPPAVLVALTMNV